MANDTDDNPLAEVSDWEEQDLLTLDEAGERLAAEVKATQAALEQARASDDHDTARREQARLDALVAALDRVRPSGPGA